MPRVFQVLRRCRRRRLLHRPLLQTTFLRLHGTQPNHPDPYPRLPANGDLRPANDTPADLAAFRKTRRRDAAAYAATVGAHLRSRDLPRAEALFHAAPAFARGPHLDAVMLDGYLKAGHVDRARRLFDGMAEKDVVAWNIMVSGYCLAGRIAEARVLFDAMPNQDVVSWTAMVQGYARNGMLSEARELFDMMPERNVVTCTVMLKAYADRGHFQKAMELFDRMPFRNSYSWNALITCFLRAGKVDEAVHLFERMQHRDTVSWNAMITGLTQNGRLLMAREFFDKMPKNKNIWTWNTMINAYANDGQTSEAQRLFDSMPAKDLVSWNILISGYAKNDRKEEAVGLFLLMLRSAVSPGSIALRSVLVTSETTVEVGQIHGMATKIGLLSEPWLVNALLTRYSRSNDLCSAWQAFKMLQEKDAITWTSMTQAFVNHGHASCALQTFAQMLRHGHEPSLTTFTTVLSACSHAGLDKKRRNILASIRPAYGLKSTIFHHDILGEVAVMPPETPDQEMKFDIKKKKSKKKKSGKDVQLAVEEPAGLEAAAAATQWTLAKAATICVAPLQASLGRLWSKTVSYLRRP